MTRVLLATTWDTDCGIAEHSAMLREAASRPDIEITPCPEALDPYWVQGIPLPYDVLHLNYHAALHSRWTAEHIRNFQSLGLKVLVTYHDTGVPNSDQCKAVVGAADAAVVHEPFDDLPTEKTHYWRMGVPEWSTPILFDHAWTNGRPVLGTVGFPFPWKCYDELARVSQSVGWALLLLAPRATLDDIDRWGRINPHLMVVSTFLPRRVVVSHLAGCDATAFTYVCHNTGQSGAILQGIAARKPLIALSTCRQMRALHGNALARKAICWADTFDDVAHYLRNIYLQRVDPMMLALAEQESWTGLGARYATLYQELSR